MKTYEMTGVELSDLLGRREITAVEVAESQLKRVDQVEPSVKAYLRIAEEGLLSAAREADDRWAKGGDRPFLAGLPIALKDNLSTAGTRTTCASKILEGFEPVYDATVVQKVRRAGGAVVGKTNLDEFAMGSSTENSAFGPTFNPWGLDRVPGGSSGGSAAAVAAGEACLALGSDTGGSIRQPAALCGVVGLKPTYGLVSRYGLIAFASSLDQIGPISTDVADCAHLLDVIAGHDRRDSTSIGAPAADHVSALVDDIKGLKIGVVSELMGEGISKDVRDVVKTAVEVLASLGAVVAETSLPSFEHALSAYYLIAPAEASSNLARYDGVRYGHRADGVDDILSMYGRTREEGFGDEVKRRIMLGTYSLSAGYYDAYYGQAQKVRTLIINDLNRAFGDFDLLVSPTSPTTAFKVGERADDPLGMYMSDLCTIPMNLAGIPAISVPCGLAEDLPVGLQIIGRALDEKTVLRAAYSYEQNADGVGRAPL